MTILIQLFEIILLKRKPQDITYDEYQCLVYAIASLTIGYIFTSLDSDWSQPFFYSSVHVLAQSGIYFLILATNNKHNRFIQSYTAILGTSVILGIVILLIQYVPILNSFILFFMIWQFYITILITRVTLDCSTFKSILVTIAVSIFSIVFLLTISPNFKGEVKKKLTEANIVLEKTRQLEQSKLAE